MTGERAGRRNALTVRLIAAFVVVAVAAVIVLSLLTLWRTRHTIGRLADERQQATADSIAETLALAYQQRGGWNGVDIHPAAMLALQADAAVAVHDTAGKEITLHNSMPAQMVTHHPNGPVSYADIVVNGETVGVAEVTFGSSELDSAERHVRDALRGTVLLGALTAAVVATAVAVPLTRRVVRPLRLVTDTAERFGRGDITARVGNHDRPGELGELAVAFDTMADRLAATELARRNVVTDLAHELRTPLTILQGNCEEVIDGLAQPTLDRFVLMHDDVTRLRRLVDDLNTLAAADAAPGEPVLRREACDLADIARHAAKDLAGTIDAHHHELRLDLEAAPTTGDPARLIQVVTNLLGNAIKYTPPGGHIGIRAAHDPAAGKAILEVSDDGVGIDPEDRPHVFERFYRGTRTKGTAGTGIGLAVAERLVHAHNGTISVIAHSPGTTITVSLPDSPPELTPSADAPTVANASRAGRASRGPA